MGEKRSLLGCYNDEIVRSNPEKRDRAKSIPKSWSEAAKRFSWKERAEAWDKWGAIELESSVIEARSNHWQKRIALEDKWLSKEAALRDRAYQWVEDYLYGRVQESRVTKKEKFSDEKGHSSEESTVEIPQAPPAWILQYFLGRRNHEKHLNVLYDLLKQILTIEGQSEDLQVVKSLIQSCLESLLLDGGAEEIRLFIQPRLKKD